MKQKSHDSLLPELRPTPRPLLVPGTILRGLVEQVNRNTVALGGPRGLIEQIAAEVDGETVTDTQANAINAITDEDAKAFFGDQVWTEISRNLEAQRVTNPEDSEQYVDVDHRTVSLFRTSAGQLMVFRFIAP